MYEDDKQMLYEIEDNFNWGIKVGGKGNGYNNLDDEQIEWMIKTIKSCDSELNHWKAFVIQQQTGMLNLLEIKRKLENELSLKDAQIQDLTVLCRGLKREKVNIDTETLQDELWEVIDHFHKLDLKAREDYQIVSVEDLEKIDWLIETLAKFLNLNLFPYGKY